MKKAVAVFPFLDVYYPKLPLVWVQYMTSFLCEIMLAFTVKDKQLNSPCKISFG